MTCNWLFGSDGQRCQREAVCFITDSHLGYCKNHHEKVLANREWLTYFLRGNMKKIFAVLALALMSAACSSAMTVNLSWTASTTPGVTYNVYRITGSCPAQPVGFTKVNPSAIAALTYSDAGLAAGTYCYYATAVGNGYQESGPSNMVQATAIAAPPGSVVVVSIQ